MSRRIDVIKTSITFGTNKKAGPLLTLPLNEDDSEIIYFSANIGDRSHLD
jgi:hypothetical protein